MIDYRGLNTNKLSVHVIWDKLGLSRDELGGYDTGKRRGTFGGTRLEAEESKLRGVS